MKTILDIIKPIKLLKGDHNDTEKTGQGCAMNVIAYLNGDDQITDESTCVCVTVRQPIIWLNDFLQDDERQELVPFLLRAMGSATTDEDIIKQRLVLVVKLANSMAELARDVATFAHNSANSIVITTFGRATHAAVMAAAAATHAALINDADRASVHASSAIYAASRLVNRMCRAADAPGSTSAQSRAFAAACRTKIKAIALAFLDAVLPRPELHDSIVFERAEKLAELYELSV